ncbi:hypothetical protein [Myceligenerans salitolerans]|uniref:Uncharacterized protein n=1 Tax=Myceligenerans salitolerans TaxID=1230528 RepID=A0ABS3I9Z8_9MICO|nr:hypothetical protein [Myceligenerans salitolerans]MBO0609852.1 hypothetical protein [Myceligenerans salitolerans]
MPPIEPDPAWQVQPEADCPISSVSNVVSVGNAMAGLAFPANTHHRDCIGKVSPALKRLGVVVFWVEQDRTVTVDQTIW